MLLLHAISLRVMPHLEAAKCSLYFNGGCRLCVAGTVAYASVQYAPCVCLNFEQCQKLQHRAHLIEQIVLEVVIVSLLLQRQGAVRCTQIEMYA